MSINVGIGCSSLVNPERIDGIGQFTQALVAHLDASEAVRVTPMLHGQEQLPQPAPHFSRGFVSGALRARLLGQSARLPAPVDLYHATDHRIPRLKGVPVVATLHDAVPFMYPQWVNPRLRRAKNWLMRETARWADQVICSTHAAVAEVVQHWKVSEEKVTVIPLGVDHQRFAADTPQALVSLRHRLGLPERYLLFIGTLQPRKNLVTLLNAHQRLPEQMRKDYPLVIAGGTGRGAEVLAQQLAQEAEQGYVQLLGYVDDGDIPRLYQAATLFVFPSLHEGFGLPILEAFASQVPVISTMGGAMQEVGGEAAVYFKGDCADALARQLATVIGDERQQQAMVARGIERAAQFSWQRTAEQTAALYRQVLESAG